MKTTSVRKKSLYFTSTLLIRNLLRKIPFEREKNTSSYSRIGKPYTWCTLVCLFVFLVFFFSFFPIFGIIFTRSSCWSNNIGNTVCIYTRKRHEVAVKKRMYAHLICRIFRVMRRFYGSHYWEINTLGNSFHQQLQDFESWDWVLFCEKLAARLWRRIAKNSEIIG